MTPVLDPDTIYLGDNGRAFCGSPRCAGTSALYTGYDISGQAVEAITTPADIRYALQHRIKCEHCGKSPRLVIPAR